MSCRSKILYIFCIVYIALVTSLTIVENDDDYVIVNTNVIKNPLNVNVEDITESLIQQPTVQQYLQQISLPSVQRNAYLSSNGYYSNELSQYSGYGSEDSKGMMQQSTYSGEMASVPGIAADYSGSFGSARANGVIQSESTLSASSAISSSDSAIQVCLVWETARSASQDRLSTYICDNRVDPDSMVRYLSDVFAILGNILGSCKSQGYFSGITGIDNLGMNLNVSNTPRPLEVAGGDIGTSLRTSEFVLLVMTLSSQILQDASSKCIYSYEKLMALNNLITKELNNILYCCRNRIKVINSLKPTVKITSQFYPIPGGDIPYQTLFSIQKDNTTAATMAPFQSIPIKNINISSISEGFSNKSFPFSSEWNGTYGNTSYGYEQRFGNMSTTGWDMGWNHSMPKLDYGWKVGSNQSSMIPPSGWSSTSYDVMGKCPDSSRFKISPSCRCGTYRHSIPVDTLSDPETVQQRIQDYLLGKSARL